MWIYGYDRGADWSAGLDSIESKLEMLLSIFHIKINNGI